MATFEPGADLDQRVAMHFGLPLARQLADELTERIRVNVPDARVWITMMDDRVRTTHKEADGQVIPGNLSFILTVPDSKSWDTPTSEKELARYPRDPNISFPNRYACRCIDTPVQGLIQARVLHDEPIVHGTAAQCEVSVEFPRIVESEHPAHNEGGGGWAARSIEEVRAGRLV